MIGKMQGDGWKAGGLVRWWKRGRRSRRALALVSVACGCATASDPYALTLG